MNRIYKASLVIVTISVFSAHCMQKNATSRKNTESTTRFMVIIDTAAANYFLNKNAIMNYSYKVVSSKNAAEGEGTFNFKNTLDHHGSSLAAFSPLTTKNMNDISINTATITIDDSVYTASKKNVVIMATGYPYTIGYDKDHDQIQILNKDNKVIMTFTRPAQEAPQKQDATQKTDTSTAAPKPAAPAASTNTEEKKT